MTLADELLRVPVDAIAAFGKSVPQTRRGPGQPSGPSHPQAIFTAEQVAAIREEYRTKPRPSIRQIAKREGVGFATIAAMLSGRSYRVPIDE